MTSMTTKDAGPKKLVRQQTVPEEEMLSTAGSPTAIPQRVSDESLVKPDLPHVTIAVAGCDGAGKTTFITSALDMRQPFKGRQTTKKMSLDGSVYLVRVLELSTTEIMPDPKGPVWPRFGSDPAPPTIDGVLVLHDITQPSTFPETAKLLDSVAASSLPFVVLASKSDVIPTHNGVRDPVLERYEIHEATPELPRSQKMCIALVLRSVVNNKRDIALSHNGQANKAVTGNSSQTSLQANPPIAHGFPHHARPNQEAAAGGPTTTTSTAPAQRADGSGEIRGPTDQLNTSSGATSTGATSNVVSNNAHGLSRFARSNSNPMRPQTPPSGTLLNPHDPSASNGNSPNKDLNRQRLHTEWQNSGSSAAFDNFLAMEEEIDGPRSAPPSPDGSRDKSNDGASSDVGYTFDELVDRLVSQPVSRQDSKFAAIFLCLYRKFAAPAQLLNALIKRFDRNEKNNTDQLSRIADQLQLLNVMAQWVSEYPGDLAHPRTRKRIVDFVSTLERSHFYMFAAKEVSSYLEIPAEDDDVGWPFSDTDIEELNIPDTPLVSSGRNSPSTFLGAPAPTPQEEEEEEEDPIYNLSAVDLSEGLTDPSMKLSGPPSSSSLVEKPGSIVSQSFTLMSTEAAQKEAHHLELTPMIPISKIVWRQFMDFSDEDVARELTRLDWVMFNSFRPRDLVRHVSISGPDKDKIKSLQNVNRMIKQFNHLAFFVASMILLRDKPKHRARALERFMNIALKLRRLNNYNSLGAVIAGINGTPVHRLSQTRDQVPVQVQKDFMRLVILMGTQKSHFAYRLAWDNSFSERIPFLPLHRRDLVSAEEGNKTFIGEGKSRINWKKFEVIGEVVLCIQRSQKTPYSQMHRYDDIQRLILDIKLAGDEEELYARSMHVEPSAGGETGRKKFGWLRS